MKMNQPYRYHLQPGGKKHSCPRCGQRRFVRYVDTTTDELLPSEFGRCDREQKCRYWRKPENITTEPFTPVMPPPAPPPSLIDFDIMAASVNHWQRSNFAQWLKGLFGCELAAEAATNYHLGASKHWCGANVFWQVDAQDRIRCGKIMLYGDDGRRVKTPRPHVSWVHSVLKLQNFNLAQCYFGEHLLAQRPLAKVAIVESEKTAIIASIYFPQFVWLATGGKNGCRWKNDPKVNSVLLDRHVVLFPDLGAFDEWAMLSERLSDVAASMQMSDLLEVNAPIEDKMNGYDLADYLIHHSVSEFRTTTDSFMPLDPFPTIIENNRN